MELKYRDFDAFLEALKACETLELFYTVEKTYEEVQRIGYTDIWTIKIQLNEGVN